MGGEKQGLWTPTEVRPAPFSLMLHCFDLSFYLFSGQRICCQRREGAWTSTTLRLFRHWVRIVCDGQAMLCLAWTMHRLRCGWIQQSTVF